MIEILELILSSLAYLSSHYWYNVKGSDYGKWITIIEIIIVLETAKN